MSLRLLLSITILFTLTLSAQTINHNGYTYKIVKSPHTGNIWLDRNIGAQRVCQSLDDTRCYGDLFQWGRNADGHEKRSSYKTRTQARSIYNAGSKFIKAKEENNYDWAHKADPKGPKRQANWQSTDGSSVCPRGFRVPTIEELEDETTEGGEVGNRQDAFKSFLKLPSAGYRSSVGGSLSPQGSYGYVWSSSVSGSGSRYLYLDSSKAHTGNDYRADGKSVRCLKD